VQQSLCARAEFAPTPNDPELARQRLRLWLRMLKAVRFIEGNLRERLRAEYDTTLPHFDVLAALQAAPDGLKMGDLSQQIMVSNGNLTVIVDRLEKEGMVARHTILSDRRACLVRITDEGQAQMGRMVAAHLAWIDELFAAVPEADTARAISILIEIGSTPAG
jgi:DNA-binding MarR family transcriptional regulator